MIDKKQKVPKLRFPEFKNNYLIYTLGEITTWKSGGTPKKDILKYWEGNIPWISASEMRGKFYEKSQYNITEEGLNKGSNLAKKGTLLLLVRGSMLFNKIPLGITKVDAAFNQDIKSLTVKKDIETEYLYQWFYAKEPKIMNLVVGTGIGAGKLDTNDMKSFQLFLPNIEEQQKIASFLSTVDKKLEQLQQKKTLLEDYKKGVMQQLFSQALRYTKEDGSEYPDWEERKLEKIVDYEQPTKYLVSSIEYDDSFETPVLTAGKTFILGYTDEINNIFSDKLPVIIFDDFTTATQFVDFPFKAKSSAMKILIPKESENIKFVYESIQNIKFEIGGHGRHWISKYSKFKIPYPCKEEQTKIANFLSALDNKIALVKTQIENTQQFKKGLLQQMFV